MKAPQIIYLSITLLNLLITAYMHGKPRTDKYNIFVTILSTTVGLMLLTLGGFFG